MYNADKLLEGIVSDQVLESLHHQAIKEHDRFSKEIHAKTFTSKEGIEVFNCPSTRTIYIHPYYPDLVVKHRPIRRITDLVRENYQEIRLYNALFDQNHSDLSKLNELVAYGSDYSFVIQKRLRPFYGPQHYFRYPWWFSDRGLDNLGWDHDRVKILDYEGKDNLKRLRIPIDSAEQACQNVFGKDWEKVKGELYEKTPSLCFTAGYADLSSHSQPG